MYEPYKVNGQTIWDIANTYHKLIDLDEPPFEFVHNLFWYDGPISDIIGTGPFEDFLNKEPNKYFHFVQLLDRYMSKEVYAMASITNEDYLELTSNKIGITDFLFKAKTLFLLDIEYTSDGRKDIIWYVAWNKDLILPWLPELGITLYA